MSKTVLLVDDSELIRRTLRVCIEENSDWEVCGEAENGEVAG
jgi:DNA-binding NarL/FixJ family response regulator